MVSKQNTNQFIVTVMLVNGEKINHTYDLPLDDDKLKEFIEDITNMIGKTMTRKEESLLFFDNPIICYNPDNVIGVHFDTMEIEKLHEMIKKSQEKLGFVKH